MEGPGFFIWTLLADATFLAGLGFLIWLLR
jgi:hypothetical protein